MAQQTAVEWLFSQIPFEWSSSKAAFEALQQANEMHEQQIRNAYNTGWDNAETYAEVSTDQYYNETYKTQNT
jgi:archaellum component FlaF (FlaF/FlaG flagellin family)